MNNNDTFSIKRLSMLVQKDVQENWKKYLMHIVTLFGVLVAVFVINTSDTIYLDGQNRDLIIMSIFTFFAMGTIFASNMMEPMNSKTKRISYLMNPSLASEKFLARWLMVTVVYIIIFLLVLVPADIARVFISSLRYPDATIRFIDFSKLVGDGDHSSDHAFYPIEVFGMVIATFFWLQSLFVLGSTFWQKNTFVKTFSIGLIIFVVFLFTCYKLIGFVFADGMNDFFDAMYSNINGTESGDTDKLKQIIITITITFSFLALGNWVLAFFRFKEAEIIKRL